MKRDSQPGEDVNIKDRIVVLKDSHYYSYCCCRVRETSFALSLHNHNFWNHLWLWSNFPRSNNWPGRALGITNKSFATRERLFWYAFWAILQKWADFYPLNRTVSSKTDCSRFLYQRNSRRVRERKIQNYFITKVYSFKCSYCHIY